MVVALWFNNKLNRINKEVQEKIIENKNIVDDDMNRFNYGELLKEQENYNATKQYFNYNETSLKQEDNAKKDDNGIVLAKYNEEYIYNPVTIAQYGLKQYSNYIESNYDQKYYENAKKQADYLLSIQDKENRKILL